MIKVVFFMGLALFSFSTGLQAGFLDKFAKGNRLYIEWDQVYVDRGDIKILFKNRVYVVPSLHSTGKRLYVYKKKAKFLCKVSLENYYPLSTPNGIRHCSKH